MVDVNKLREIVEFSSQPANKKLDEATFFGKNKKLLETEAILDEMIQIAATKGVAAPEFSRKMVQVGNNLAEIFGFNSVSINSTCLFMMSRKLLFRFTASSGCTLCHSVIIKYSRMMVGNLRTERIDFDKSHQGIRFKPGSMYNMRMFLSSTLFIPNGQYTMTGGEILAIMLHEIGHNFYVGPIREFGYELLGAMTAADCVDFILGRMQTIMLLEATDIIDGCLPNEAKTAFSWVANVLGYIMSPIYAGRRLGVMAINTMIFVLYFAQLIATIPMRMIKATLKYDSEKYSDAFATSYGYGPELTTALAKMGHFKMPGLTNDKTQEVMDFFVTLLKLPVSMIYALSDPHPNSEGRLMNDIKYMEAAGDKITDPALKKEYKANIKKMYALRAEMKGYKGTNPVSLGSKATAMLEDFLNISDYKDLVSGLNPTITRYKNLDITM